eukprot:Pgem_evm1s6580
MSWKSSTCKFTRASSFSFSNNKTLSFSYPNKQKTLSLISILGHEDNNLEVIKNSSSCNNINISEIHKTEQEQEKESIDYYYHYNRAYDYDYEYDLLTLTESIELENFSKIINEFLRGDDNRQCQLPDDVVLMELSRKKEITPISSKYERRPNSLGSLCSHG